MTRTKITLRCAISVLFITLITLSQNTYAAQLNITHVYQEQTNWCWAAASQMVLSFYDVSKTQTAIVTYIKGSPVNEGGSEQDIQKVLSNNGVPATVSGVLSQTAVNEAANKGKPFVIAWYWTAGGGHAVTYDGYEGTQYYIHDPWYGPQVMTYNSIKSAQGQGTWRQSICSTKEKQPTDVVMKTTRHGSNAILYSGTGSATGVCFALDPALKLFNGKIAIYDTHGRLIHSIALSPEKTRYFWDRRTRTGPAHASAEIYFAIMTAADSQGKIISSLQFNTIN